MYIYRMLRHSTDDENHANLHNFSLNTSGKLRYSDVVDDKGDAWKTLLGSASSDGMSFYFWTEPAEVDFISDFRQI